MTAGTSTAEPATFERVSRVKGVVFERLSLAASLLGILALSVLLVYVTVDAFGLASASHAWILAVLATVDGPVLGLWLYSARDPATTRRTLLALGGGLAGSYAVVRGLAVAGFEIPTLSWSLLYLFAVVVPTTAAVLYAGSQRPVGAVGLGVLGRLLAGAILGVALIVLFRVLAPERWVLAYTLGVLPAAAVLAYARENPSSWGSLLPAPTLLVGVAAALWLDDLFVLPFGRWGAFVWSLAIPAAAVAALVGTRREGREVGTLAGGVVLGGVLLGSLAAPLVGVAPGTAVLLLGPVGLPAGWFAVRVWTDGEGRLGLLAPVVLLLGAATAAAVVETAGLAGPTPWLDWGFLTSPHSRTPEDAGLYPAIVGSVMIVSLVAVISFVSGVGAAVFLEDYTPDQGPMGSLARSLQVNIANLAAVPSVVYGLLGLGLFANLLGTGYGTVVTAAVTLSLLILPITIIAAQEAVRAVPDDLRRGSYAMGATRWQTTREVVLPEAMSGILTGTILALGRAIGETAPLLMIGLADTAFTPPDGIWDTASAMPMQIYAWYSFPQDAFQRGVLAAGVVTLLAVLIAMNGTAMVLRDRHERSS